MKKITIPQPSNCDKCNNPIISFGYYDKDGLYCEKCAEIKDNDITITVKQCNGWSRIFTNDLYKIIKTKNIFLKKKYLSSNDIKYLMNEGYNIKII